MPNRSGTAKAAKTKARKEKAGKTRVTGPEQGASRRAKGRGALPEWDLSGLYASIDSAEVTSDLTRADALAVGFEERCRGRLGEIVTSAESMLA